MVSTQVSRKMAVPFTDIGNKEEELSQGNREFSRRRGLELSVECPGRVVRESRQEICVPLAYRC